jgi:hypothetical protein
MMEVVLYWEWKEVIKGYEYKPLYSSTAVLWDITKERGSTLAEFDVLYETHISSRFYPSDYS